MTAVLKEYINAWLQKAESDIISAQRLLEIEPMILDSACFHCQQAVEKSLKAFLCYTGKEIEKTHDIDFLLGECAVFDLIFSTINPLNLNEYAVRIRYPDLSLSPSVEEVKTFYQLAITINNLVKERIVFTD
jgi:HEPN domain-containing protein